MSSLLRRYHAEVDFPIFDATKDESVPERVKLVAAVVHDTSQIVVNLFWSQRVTIIPHVIIQPICKKASKGFVRYKKLKDLREKKKKLESFLHELIKITKNLLKVADFSAGTEKRMLANSLHSLNVLVS